MWHNFNVILNAAAKVIGDLNNQPPSYWSCSPHYKIEHIRHALYRLEQAILIKTDYISTECIRRDKDRPSPIKEEYRKLLTCDFFDGAVYQRRGEMLEHLDLSSIEAMLSIEISQKAEARKGGYFQGHEFEDEPGGFFKRISLERSLNIARDNILNFPDPSLLTQGSFFGATVKSKATFDQEVVENRSNREMTIG